MCSRCILGNGYGSSVLTPEPDITHTLELSHQAELMSQNHIFNCHWNTSNPISLSVPFPPRIKPYTRGGKGGTDSWFWNSKQHDSQLDFFSNLRFKIPNFKITDSRFPIFKISDSQFQAQIQDSQINPLTPIYTFYELMYITWRSWAWHGSLVWQE